MVTAEISQLKCNLDAIHRYLERKKKANTVFAVPFYPIFWGTNQIFYDCQHCYKDEKINTGDIPYFCNQPEHLEEFIKTGARLTRCINCQFYHKR